MRTVKIKCPAKINLGLKVLNKRPDGFHNIDSVMQTISLYDYLTISVSEGDEGIFLSGTSDEIPYDERNLVYKTGKLFLEAAGISGKRIEVFIEKNIPVSAGLAGGSTDAAGMIYGMNKLFDECLTDEELHELCAKSGSDLNFCLKGGRARTSGRGEILEPVEFERFSVSLIKPKFLGISAGEAYTKFSAKKAAGNSKLNRDDFVNDLEWAVIEDYPELLLIKKKYPKSVMTGSGSTYFLINDAFSEESGYRVLNGLKAVEHGVCAF